MGPSSYATASAELVSSSIPRSLQDGGSSVGLTQGEIIFVTLACFVVVIAAIFAIYTIYMKRRRAANTRQNNYASRTPVMVPAITIEDGMDKYPKTDVNNSMLSRESNRQNNRRSTTEEDRTRRATMESVDSTGKRARRASTGSTGSNVSNQYKVAAMNQMRRMSELSDQP